MEQKKIMLSREEGQELLGIGRVALQSLINRQEHPLPTVQIGKRLLIPRDALGTWIEEETGRVKNLSKG